MAIVACNWKMSLGMQASTTLMRVVHERASTLMSTRLMLAPSAHALDRINNDFQARNFELGAQNVCWQDSGAFTGELSCSQLGEVGCTFTLVGHSERRRLCGESDECAARRALFALQQQFVVIFCVGESADERRLGGTTVVVERQLRDLISGLSIVAERSVVDGASVIDGESASMLRRLIIAYEPVWAIGSGNVATPLVITKAHRSIQQVFQRAFPSQSAPPILYGGSVTKDNFGEILSVPDVAGALVGSASTKESSLLALIDISEQLARS